MKMTIRRSQPGEAATPTAIFVAVMAHLAASRATKEQLEPATVRSRVMQDSRRALRERLAPA